jgi:hypothetical protein
MVAKIDINVTLSNDAAQWGRPTVNTLEICWSNEQINGYESDKVNESRNIDVNADIGKTISHTMYQEFSGYVNIFIGNGDRHFLIGEPNYPVEVAQISSNINALIQGLDPTMRLGNSNHIEVTQLGTNWQLVRAPDGDWGDNNSCYFKQGDEESVSESEIINNVENIHMCAVDGVQAFDYDPLGQTCQTYRNTSFNARITSTLGRSKPNTKCYMRRTVYNAVAKHKDYNPYGGKTCVNNVIKIYYSWDEVVKNSNLDPLTFCSTECNDNTNCKAFQVGSYHGITTNANVRNHPCVLYSSCSARNPNSNWNVYVKK